MTGREFEQAFDQHKDAVYRFAWRMTNSSPSAEDIAQEVFLFLFRSPERFDASRAPLRSFLLGVTRNLVLKRWRDERRHEDLEGLEFVAFPVDIERLETAEIVAKAVGGLPPLQREVLILAEYEGMSLEEIARTVQSEVGAVKSRLHRARENLRQMLAPLKGLSTHGTT
jgi:RNA polymerase sigma-70 factor (ECF subfamily)